MDLANQNPGQSGSERVRAISGRSCDIGEQGTRVVLVCLFGTLLKEKVHILYVFAVAATHMPEVEVA